MKLPDLKGLYAALDQKKKKMLIAGGIGTLVLFFAFVAVLSRSIYAVSVNGKFIGNAQDEQVIERIKEKIKEGYMDEAASDVKFLENIEIESVRAFGNKVDSEDELLEKLSKELSVQIKAVAININNQEIAVVKDKETADKVLQGVKDHYINSTPGELIKVEVAETVKLAEKYVNPSSIMSAEDVVKLILQGTMETKSYTVQKGDTLWDIAKRQNIALDDLIKANPQLESEDKLALGDVLNLTEIKPLLNVSVVKKVTYEESIPYTTKVEKDNSMYEGQQKVKQAGENGKKEIAAEVLYKNGIKVSQETLGEKVIKEPVTKIVSRGTKADVAYRGSGRFAWPAVGRITSRYGYRGREFHTGVDIANSKGTTIRAADDGTVTFAGRHGNYGNLIIINHGGGIETYYAHCNSINVSVGDKVQQGEKIGTVGTTGRTTGPHVHFEVRVNGNHKNPLNYLGK